MCVNPKEKDRADHRLLLGWERGSDNRQIGFAPHRHAVPTETRAISYSGDGHLLTVAPTGAGKGRGVIIPNLLTYPGPVIVIDPKGENYQVTARRRREMGQRVIVLDPFRVTNANSDRLNPLDVFNLPRADVEAEAEMLANMLALGHEIQTDRYWNDTASGVHGGLLAHIGTAEPPEKRTLNRLREFLFADDMDYNLAVLLDTKAVKSRLAREEIVAYLSAPSDKTRPCIRSTATTYVKSLGSTGVAETLGQSSFELKDVVDGKPLSIYIVIPPEKLDSHKSLLRLWVGTLLLAVAARRRIPRDRTLFLLDECAQLGQLSALKTAVTLLRGKGLHVWTFWQDLSQLQHLYPVDWKTMVHNASVLQVFGLANYVMAKDWTDFVGRDGEELMDVSDEDAILFTKRERYHVCRRADYLRDRAFHGAFDANEIFALHPLHDDAAYVGR